MDFICLYICVLCMKVPIKPLRILAASFIGGLFSVLSLLLEGNGIVSVIITVFVGLLMCYVVFGCKNLIRFFVSFIIYLAVSFFMAGGLTVLYSWMNDILPSFSSVPVSPSEILFPAALLCAAASLFFSRVSNRYTNRKSAEIHIEHLGISLTVTALVDSGNLLCDPISGLPVILLSRRASLEFVPNGNFAPEFIAGLRGFEGKLRLIPVKQNGSTSILSAFSPTAIAVNGESRRCLVALSENEAFGGTDALVHPSLLPITNK